MKDADVINIMENLYDSLLRIRHNGPRLEKDESHCGGVTDALEVFRLAYSQILRLRENACFNPHFMSTRSEDLASCGE